MQNVEAAVFHIMKVHGVYMAKCNKSSPMRPVLPFSRSFKFIRQFSVRSTGVGSDFTFLREIGSE